MKPLLVVYENCIILFSDKSCEFPNTGKLDVDWSRWYRKAILASAQQVRGAERWLKQYPERVYLDNKCSQKLPISLGKSLSHRFYRVIVARGALESCRAHIGGDGGLMLAPDISGNAHFDSNQGPIRPFCVGKIDETPGHLHIFDDYTLPLVLKEVDTISDFISYLEFKEKHLGSIRDGQSIREENVLAQFLTHLAVGLAEPCVSPEGPVASNIKSDWAATTRSDWYRKAKEYLGQSYVWDRIIQEFATHAFGGTLYGNSPKTIAENEQIFRCLAGEPRVPRSYLVAKMLEHWRLSKKKRKVHYRIVASPTFADTLYVFVVAPNGSGLSKKARKVRQDCLQNYCFLVHIGNPKYRRVIGIATAIGDDPYRTFDAFLIEGDRPKPEMQEIAQRLQREMGVTGQGTIHQITDHFGQNQKVVRTTHRQYRTDGKVGRNDPCPCLSGRKFKHCCLAKQ